MMDSAEIHNNLIAALLRVRKPGAIPSENEVIVSREHLQAALKLIDALGRENIDLKRNQESSTRERT